MKYHINLLELGYFLKGIALTALFTPSPKIFALAFGIAEFLHEIRKLKYHAVTGVRCDSQSHLYRKRNNLISPHAEHGNESIVTGH
ncbi:hypothetical protein WA1_19445 [Scytonema hofmannii PCC 7110]|uniref:Uncharacterized protein n=1 Tax=Scytonema hofmannii PCC 7110 TaxID=128403 RepID=A0A139XBX2_9CYAN|nr:hypothetical protein [Scytonema hofmannii]KYC42166.1 hypothetical protein WA1_19445 [Scytonema hofmannii PCC 7110]